MVFPHSYLRVGETLLDQGYPDGFPGGISRVQHPGTAMGPFPGEVDAAVFHVESRSCCHQFPHPLRAFADQYIHRPYIAQAGPRFQGVLHVQERGIFLMDCCSYSPLGQAGTGFFKALFG